MTAIQGFIAPSRRPGELAIHSVDHFHFVVPDLAVAKNFYGDFGLDIGERGNTVTLKTFEQAHLWGTIGEGPRKKYGYVSFGAFEEDIERFAQRLEAMRIERLDPPPGVELRTGCGFAITTASWWKSKSPRNLRPTKKPISRLSQPVQASAVRRFAAPCRERGRAVFLTS